MNITELAEKADPIPTLRSAMRRKEKSEICGVDGCDRNVLCKEVCARHYSRGKVYGRPDHPGVKDRRSWEEKFLSKIDRSSENGCWPWLGFVNRAGYGSYSRQNAKGNTGAHRIAYEYFIGSPGDLFVCHKCDNPICVRPDHMFLGTPDDNIQDMVSKGRHKIGQVHPKAKLTDEDVFSIRARYQRRSKTNGIPSIAKDYGLSTSTVGGILRGKIWRHLLGNATQAAKREMSLMAPGVAVLETQD